MEVIKTWALSVSAASVITTVIGFLSPSGSFDKSLKIIAAFFMLLCFIVPFTETEAIKYMGDEVEKMSEWLVDNKFNKEIENEVAEMLQTSVKSQISAYLNNIGIDNADINVKIEIDENQNIEIVKISIVLFNEINIDSLATFVESTFEVLPEITVCLEE